MKRIILPATLIAIALLSAVFVSIALAKPKGPALLAGNKIPQFVDPLPSLHIIDGTAGSQIVLEMNEFQAEVLPTGTFTPGIAPKTWVWGYRQPGQPATRPYIGPVIVAERGTPTEIKFVNNLGTTATTQLKFWRPSTDQTLHWANPNNLPMYDPQNKYNINPAVLNNYGVGVAAPIPAVPHLHGGEIPPQVDGGPDAWFYDPSLSLANYTSSGHAYYTKGLKARVALLPDPPGPNYPPGTIVLLSTDGYLYQVNLAGDAWVKLSDTTKQTVFRYPNTQESAALWFHDHLLGATRLNVYAGLAGAYVIYDPVNDLADLSFGTNGSLGIETITPLVIQDRMFDATGELYFPNVGINPEHPFWVPEFVGDTIVVNGKVWPHHVVQQKRNRFLFLNGSNARAYDMYLQDTVSGVKGPPLWVIGTDGGYLDTPVMIDPNAQKKVGPQSLVMMPGERYDVVIDFNDAAWLAAIRAAYPGGVPGDQLNLVLRNTARTPYPAGAPAAQSTTGRILQFRIPGFQPNGVIDTSWNPAAAALLPPPSVDNTSIERLQAASATVKRRLTLNEIMGPGGPLEVLVNNTRWDGAYWVPSTTNPPPETGYGAMSPTQSPTGYKPVVNSDGTTYFYSELPQEGVTELWEIVNLTADAHPIHLHLVQFQLMNRQPFDVVGYGAAYAAAFPGIPNATPAIPAGTFIPEYGPPLKYDVPVGGFIGGNPDIAPNQLVGPAAPPQPYEQGWKDTVIAYPGEVTRFLVRWAPTDAAAPEEEHYPFDPNAGHGYVWHCHIIDHEDNEMMRPTLVEPKAGVTRTYVMGNDY